jgi:hypothetical protein
MIPEIIIGSSHKDARGTLLYNNSFDATQVKRIYFIENRDTDFVRGWQGHKIEQRWFSAVKGAFRINVLPISCFNEGVTEVNPNRFELMSSQFNVLFIPAGFVTAIQAIEPKSKLLVMADYHLGEINDEFRFEYKF